MQRMFALLLTISVLLLAAGMLAAADRNNLDAESRQVTEQEAKTSQPKQLTVDDIVVPDEMQTELSSEVNGMSAEDAADLVTRAIMAGEDINWQVVCGGGGIEGSSTNYLLSGAVGQASVGSGTSTNYTVYSGFWQNFQAVNNDCQVAGDANSDGDVNIGDIVYLIAYIFRGGPPPALINEGDVNSDCALNLGDPVYLINFAFRSGPPPTCGCVFTK